MGQITKMRAGNHQPVGEAHAGSVPTAEDEDDNIDDNGTDYNGKGPNVKKSLRLYKSLIQDEALLKACADDEGEEEEEDEPPFGEEVVRKSFFDHVEANTTLMDGLESSPFLYEMVKSIGYSFMNLEDRLGAQMFVMDTNYDQFAKSIDGVFENMSKSLGIINETADQIDVQKAAGPDENVELLEKGGFGEESGPDRQQILNSLVKGVADGHIPATEVIKFETTGGLSPHIQKSLGL